MHVAEVMTTAVITAGEQTAFRDLVSLLAAHSISSVPIVDADGTLVGLVTEADLLSKEAYPEGRSRRALTLLADMLGGKETRWLARADGVVAGDIMSLDPASVPPTADVHTAARLLLDGGVSQLPVVEDGRLVGIVTRRDLLRVFLRNDDAVLADTKAALRAALGEDAAAVSVTVENGLVTLTGELPQHGQDTAARTAVEGVPGVVEVVADLAVGARRTG